MPRITLVHGDLTKQRDVDAVVNAANCSLLGGGGVDGAIHRAAGRGLMEACRAMPIMPGDEVGEATRNTTVGPVRCPVGEARVTPAFNLAPIKYVIHTVGPKYDPTQPCLMKGLLTRAYECSIASVVSLGCRSVAIPAISAGVYGYPLIEAAEVALTVAYRAWDLDEIRFVLFLDEVYDVFSMTLTALQEK